MTTTQNYTTYIVILNYKRWYDVVECLTSVFNLSYKNFSVIVIDNDSQNDSLQHLMKWVQTKPHEATENIKEILDYKYYTDVEFNQNLSIKSLPKLSFVQNSKNLGFAAGNNVVLKNLLNIDAFVWLLNPDMEVDKNALTELVSCNRQQNSKSIIGAVIKSYENPEKVLFYGGAKINFNTATIKPAARIGDINNIDYITGGSMFIHTEHLREIGLLPEKYFLFWEETHWCYEAKLKGYKMVVCLAAVCYDKISTSIGKGFLADYYYTYNGLKFINRFKKNKTPQVILFSLIRMIKRLMMGKFDRAGGVYKGLSAFLKSRNES